MPGQPMSVGWPPVSTPRSIDVPTGVRRITLKTARGRFAAFSSLTLMSSGPGPLTGPAAGVLQAILTPLRGLTGPQLRTEVKRVWNLQLAPQAQADGTPPHIIDFLRRRMLGNHPAGLVA